MCKDAGGAALQQEEDVGTQRLAKKGIRAFAFAGRRVWDANNGARRAGGQEGCLEEWPLDFFQVGLPKLQVATGDKGGPDGVVKDIFNSKLGNDAGLVVGNPKLLCHLMASLRGEDVCWLDRSEGQDREM